MSEAQELLRELRARVELSEEADWLWAAQAPQAPPVAAPRPIAAAISHSMPDADHRMKTLREAVSACRQCPLGEHRLNPVFGVGSIEAQVMFVGEGPGFQEDHEGEPFIGKAGQLLDKILAAINLSRESVYIANVVKCHPMIDPSNPEAHSNDRPPTPEEMAACKPFLEEQVRLISPRVIVTLGSVATRALLGEEVAISKVRGHWREYRTPGDARTIKLLPTYHPAALLRNPALKQDVWTDMKNLRKELEGQA